MGGSKGTVGIAEGDADCASQAASSSRSSGRQDGRTAAQPAGAPIVSHGDVPLQVSTVPSPCQAQ